MPAVVGLPRNHTAEPENAGRAVIIGIQEDVAPPALMTRPWAVSGSALMTWMLTWAPVVTVMAGAVMPAMRKVSSGPPAGLATTGSRTGGPVVGSRGARRWRVAPDRAARPRMAGCAA